MAKGKRWRDAPSPCVGICRFRNAGRCIGCAMTKGDRKRFKRLDAKPDKKRFLADLAGRLAAMGRYAGWARVYRRKCARKAVPCPLDKLPEAGRIEAGALPADPSDRRKDPTPGVSRARCAPG